MDKEFVERIKSNPKFKELVEKRGRLAWQLTIAMLVVYYAFILVIAFVPSLFAIKVSGVITLGIPVGILVIVIAFGLTGMYVKKANSEFDTLTKEINDDVRRVQ